MCGIVALFAYGDRAPPVKLDELCAIRDRMALRGPDGTGEWLSGDERVALGHRRLSIIDLRSIADQPMAHDNGRLRIVFNGEIYNYKELKAELEAKGRRFRTESDTEVILQLYDAEGAGCVRKLRGMFAFALYDEGRGGMLLARDPLGIKPLYIADDGATVRVASQVKALVAGGHVADKPDPAGHVGFFLWGAIPEPYTLYAGIRSLPAGSTQWFDDRGKHTPQRYWRVADALSAPPLDISPTAAREELRAALLDSLHHHFVADVPVGMFLSAGLDSTTLTALATEDGASNLRTITLGFQEFAGSENDEAPLAELLAKQRRTEHTTRWVRAEEFAADRAALADAMDQPSIDGVNTYFVAKAAHEAGLKVALSGLGGDELFAGYPSFRDIPRIVGALGPFNVLSGLGKITRQVTSPWLGNFTSPKYAGLLEYGSDYAGAYMLRRCLFMPWEIAEVLPPDMAELGLRELETHNRLEDELPTIENPRLKVAALEIAWYMRHQLLRDSDWAGMAHSLEIRVPLADATLLTRLAPLLASAAPPSKSDMADTCNTKLPDAIRTRAKTGFMAPVREWTLGEAGGSSRGLRGWAKLVYDQQAGAVHA